MELRLSLAAPVLANTDFFPAIRFLHLDAYDWRPTSLQPLSGETVDPDYAVCVVDCEQAMLEFRL